MTTPSIKKRKQNTIILVDKKKPQFFQFDTALIFDEKPINKALAVELLMEGSNSAISAETSLLFAKKIRIVCPKATPLKEGVKLILNLSGLYQEFQEHYLLNIPCTLSTVENYQHVTHAVLSFTDAIDCQFNEWYQNWLTQFQELHKSDEIDEHSFQFIYQYYKRLYAAHLPHPVLLSNQQKIQHTFISKPCSSNITFVNEHGTNIQVPLSIFQAHIKHQNNETRIPVYVWYEDKQIFHFSNRDYPKVSSKRIVSWLRTKKHWRVLLVRNRHIFPIEKLQCNEIKQYVTAEAVTNNEEFRQSFADLSTSTHILDISCLFANIQLPMQSESFSATKQTTAELFGNYQLLSFQVKRAEHRYEYHTGITLTTEVQEKSATIKAEIINISFLGLGVIIPVADYPFKENDTIMVEFTEWNDNLPSRFFKKAALLETIEYTIISIYKNPKNIFLGLKRIKRDTDPTLNSFIRNKLAEIEQSKPGCIHNDFDLYQSLFSSLWVNNNITGLAFFLGRDSNGIRIIQAIVSTQENSKIRSPYQSTQDWTFLQQIALPLDIAINKLNPEKNNANNSLNIGIYCYFDSTGTTPKWLTKTDLDFQTIEQKSSFITTAMQHKKHFFYHCSLIAISPGKDDILKGESSAFVSLAAHRLKEIHDICRALIAIGELNDVTRLIEFMHKG
jgi:hypothetical protein